jgi:hypothetical protein
MIDRKKEQLVLWEQTRQLTFFSLQNDMMNSLHELQFIFLPFLYIKPLIRFLNVRVFIPSRHSSKPNRGD